MQIAKLNSCLLVVLL
uniref:Uncharacterized protein n=1 Tax=Rhizophora mucronata TaxID=61149 RepID=A0A2P2IRW5_RHIMU